MTNFESETLTLARKLNAVEIVHAHKPESSKAQQVFDYLFVLDFEATCWDFKEKKNKNHEIIEFSVVLYSIEKQCIVEEFQKYVKPVENPLLSNFCTSFLGIEQERVQHESPFPVCLGVFTKWIEGILKKYRISFPNSLILPGFKLCAFVTWTDWDFGVCLPKECERKNISKPDMFKQWSNLRALYMEHYSRRPRSLVDALRSVGLSFEGNTHCGLHDARNTAYLAQKMIDDGLVLKITKML